MTTKKVLVVGKKEEAAPIPEGLKQAFELPSGVFDPPRPPRPFAKTYSLDSNISSKLSEGDLNYLFRLRRAFTRTQAQWFDLVRSVVMASNSWRNSDGPHFGLAGNTNPMPEWITNNGRFRQEGRTFLLAVVYIEKGLTYPGARLTLEDHVGYMGDDLLDAQIKDLVDVDATIKRRASFACRGELVIASEKQLESLIAP